MVEAIIALLSSIFTIVVMVLKTRSREKSLSERVKEKKHLVDYYIEKGRYEHAAVMASDALDRIDFFLRSKKRKNPPQ